MKNLTLPLTFHHNETIAPVSNQTKIKSGDQVTFLVNLRRKDEAEEWFNGNGWKSNDFSPT